MNVYSGEDLSTIDLIIDAVYRGSYERPTLLVLTSNLAEHNWPDDLDLTTGRFVYYGDNKQPGNLLHETPRFGNRLLKHLFDLAHGNRRVEVPPILVFTSESPGRSFRFRGLAVPGHPAMPSTEDLIAIWKTSGNERFQNYRAVFTILDTPVISRHWVHQMGAGHDAFSDAPPAWQTWVTTGVAKPLEAPRSQLVRTQKEQRPTSEDDWALIDTIKDRYKDNAFGFEACAGELTKLLLGGEVRLDLTRPWRDGGRDGIGTLRIGRGLASIGVAFALEAKCYGRRTSVGVTETSRLISRIKHREFGVLVTLSYVNDQAYREVVDDGHPVIFVTAVDVVRLLRDAGYGTSALVNKWLDGLSLLTGIT